MLWMSKCEAGGWRARGEGQHLGMSLDSVVESSFIAVLAGESHQAGEMLLI